jgi:charged multivesicular body protein 4
MFTNLFGKKNKENPKTPQEAIQELRGVQDLLNKKEAHLEKKIQEEVDVARKHGMKNKRAALQALARKKRYEKQLTQIDGTLTTVEFQIDALENASTNTEVLKAMQVAAKSLKAAHNNMDIDAVHNVMDDIHEQQEIAQEISDAISQPTGFGHDVDEDELMAELEAMQEQDLENKLLDVGGSSVAALDKLPAAPSAEPRQPERQRNKQQEEEDQMKELAEWAS